MSFNVPAESYGRFMGRYSEPLAGQFVDLVGATAGQRALDVGCGPGALTARLAERLGADAVAAVDPSEPFLAAARARLPGVDIRSGTADRLPFGDDEFDLALAQLVVHFMPDPVAGLTEMARVTRPGGVVAASVWDHAGAGGPLTPLWDAVHELDPGAHGEADLPGAREGTLARLLEQAGLHEVQTTALTVTVRYATFDEWWEPFTLGVGPAGSYVAGLDPDRRETLRATAERRRPTVPFDVSASAWCVTARA